MGNVPFRSTTVPLRCLADSPAIDDAGVVRAHAPFTVVLVGVRLARRADTALVATYPTPAGEYAGYLSPHRRFAGFLRRPARRYERRLYDLADLVVALQGRRVDACASASGSPRRFASSRTSSISTAFVR